MAGSSQSSGSSSSYSDTYIPDYSETPILNEIALHARAMSDTVYNWGMDRFNKNQGDIDGLMRDALSYASPQRIAVDMGQAEAGVQQAGERGRQSAVRDLESYGIDPSSGRYAALDSANRVMTAASAAGAGNQQRMADQAAGNAMRNQAISAGLQNAQFGLGVGNSANAFLQTGMQLKYPPLGRYSTSESKNESSSVTGDGGGGSKAQQPKEEKPPQEQAAKDGGAGAQPGGAKGAGGGAKVGKAGPKEQPPDDKDPVPKDPEDKKPDEDESDTGDLAREGQRLVGETPDPEDYESKMPPIPDPAQPDFSDIQPADTSAGDESAGLNTGYRGYNEDNTDLDRMVPSDLGPDFRPQPGDATTGPTSEYNPYEGNVSNAAFTQDANIDPTTGELITDNDQTTTDPAGGLLTNDSFTGESPFTSDFSQQGISADQYFDPGDFQGDYGGQQFADTATGYDPAQTTDQSDYGDPWIQQGDDQTDYSDPGMWDTGDYGNYDFGDNATDYGDYGDQTDYTDYGDDTSNYDDYGDDSSNYDDYSADDYGDYGDDSSSYDDYSADDYGDDSSSYDDYSADDYGSGDDYNNYDDTDYSDYSDYGDSGGDEAEYARGGSVRRKPGRGPMRPPMRRPMPTGYRPRPPGGGPLRPNGDGRGMDPPPVAGGGGPPRPPQAAQVPRPPRGAPMMAPGGPRPPPMPRGPMMPGNMISANGMPPPMVGGQPPPGPPRMARGGPAAGPRAPRADPTQGGFVSRELSPSAGSQTDDVNARLNAGEFVIPKDVAAFKGREFFYKMIAQARKMRSAGNTPQRPQVGYRGGGRPR